MKKVIVGAALFSLLFFASPVEAKTTKVKSYYNRLRGSLLILTIRLRPTRQNLTTIRQKVTSIPIPAKKALKALGKL